MKKNEGGANWWVLAALVAGGLLLARRAEPALTGDQMRQRLAAEFQAALGRGDPHPNFAALRSVSTARPADDAGQRILQLVLRTLQQNSELIAKGTMALVQALTPDQVAQAVDFNGQLTTSAPDILRGVADAGELSDISTALSESGGADLLSADAVAELSAPVIPDVTIPDVSVLPDVLPDITGLFGRRSLRKPPWRG